MSPADEARWEAAATRHDAGMDALAAGEVEAAWADVDGALDTLSALLGDDHPEVGHVRVSRGMVALARGALAEARADMEAGLAVLDAWEDPAGAPLRVRACTQLSDLVRQLGEYAPAVALAERATREAEQLEAEDPQVYLAWNILGIALRFAGRMEAAEAAYHRALAALAVAAPDEHDARATLLHNLGGLAHGRGDGGAAVAYVREALALREAAGDEGSGYALDLGLLAAALEEAGQLDEALATFERAARAVDATFPPGHPERAYRAHNHGDALVSAGRFAEAEAKYREALTGKLLAFEADHPEVAITRARLAGALAEQGRLPEARAEAAEALAVTRVRLPEGHPFRELAQGVAEGLGVR